MDKSRHLEILSTIIKDKEFKDSMKDITLYGSCFIDDKGNRVNPQDWAEIANHLHNTAHTTIDHGSFEGDYSASCEYSMNKNGEILISNLKSGKTKRSGLNG